MNPLSPTNPPQAPLTTAGRDHLLDIDVTFSDESLCDFSEWLDHELAALEEHFADFVTAKSRKRSCGR